MTGITDRLARVSSDVRNALVRASRRPDDVILVAVSKGHSADAVREAYAAGQRHFGESYVQEALPKIEKVAEPDIVWHFIGRLQGNKTRAVAERFQWVHTLDRERTAVRLDAQRPFHAAPLQVLIQVSLAGEAQKGGVGPEEAMALAEALRPLSRLRLRGLMTIAPAGLAEPAAGALFDELRELATRLRAAGFGADTLSMGMSEDFALAIEHGSNCVRIGSAIFGTRAQKKGSEPFFD